MATVAFTGAGGGRMAKLADHLFAVASKETARIQEAHILAGHMLCDWIELDCVSGAEQESAVALEIAAAAQVEGGR
jgi:D-sedoheptulose 7-phosphate isomerase